MDRLISEKKAIEAINDYWGEMEIPTIDGYINAIKAIPSAYKGMTNGEVIKALFPQYTYMGVCVFDKNENIILHDINWNWWNSPYEPRKSEEVNG